MKTVRIKLDLKRKHRNAFYFSSIGRVVIKNLEVDDYFDMRISNVEIEITSNNEELINMLKELAEEAEDENS